MTVGRKVQESRAFELFADLLNGSVTVKVQYQAVHLDDIQLLTAEFIELGQVKKWEVTFLARCLFEAGLLQEVNQIQPAVFECLRGLLKSVVDVRVGVSGFCRSI